MNREILFRGKRVDNGEWVEGDLAQDTDLETAYVGGFNYYTDGDGLQREPFQYEVDPSTVCQYTGLTDRNGKKIFEGDILKWDEKEWGCPFFETVTWNYELFEIRQHEWKSFCEVIGNIFDNPELLEENNT